MTRSNSSDNSLIWLVCGLILVSTVFVNMFAANDASNLPSTPQTSDPASHTPEYQYARTRFRQEGYSAAESDAAASAVYKFHQAQQARR